MKKLITSAAVVLGLAVAGNAMAQETITTAAEVISFFM